MSTNDAQVEEVPAVQESEVSAGLATLGPEVVPAQCPSCQTAAASPQAVSKSVPSQFAYFLCHVVAEHPNLGVEKYAQLKMRGVDFKGLPPDDALHLALERNPDLARQECYIALVEGVETYMLMPAFPEIGFSMLVEATKHEISAVIGKVGPIASPDMCNGVALPIVFFDVVFNFNQKEFVEQIPVPDKADKAKFEAAANSLWDKLAPLIGRGTGKDRALTHLILSDHSLWSLSFDELSNNNAVLKSVEMKPAHSTTRSLVNVFATFLDRGNSMERIYYQTCDVSGKFVFKLDPPWRLWAGSAP
jgi:hypothetical protein